MISQHTVLPNDSDEELGQVAACMDIIPQDDHVQVLLCSLVCNLTWHTSWSRGFCEVPMCTASTERMTIKSSDIILAPFFGDAPDSYCLLETSSGASRINKLSLTKYSFA